MCVCVIPGGGLTGWGRRMKSPGGCCGCLTIEPGPIGCSEWGRTGPQNKALAEGSLGRVGESLEGGVGDVWLAP